MTLASGGVTFFKSNMSPSKVAGYQARAGRIGSAVGNFFTKKSCLLFAKRGLYT